MASSRDDHARSARYERARQKANSYQLLPIGRYRRVTCKTRLLTPLSAPKFV
jgi:hypothetical protein